MMKEYKRWRMGPDEKSSSILSPFLLSRAVFSTWQTYPNPLPPNFGPPPAPGSATGNTARQSLLPFQLTSCAGSTPWDNTRRGSNYPASEIQLSTSLWRVNTSSALMTKFKEFFKQNVPIRFIPNIMTNKLLKSLCYIGSFRDRGRFCEGFACNELLE